MRKVSLLFVSSGRVGVCVCVCVLAAPVTRELRVARPIGPYPRQTTERNAPRLEPGMAGPCRSLLTLIEVETRKYVPAR